MAKLQRILSGLVIIGVIIGAILISPIVFITFWGGPCPVFPPDIQIAIQRNGPGEWLPVVKELESFVPTVVSSSNLHPYPYLEGGYTENITWLIEQYQQESPGTVVRGSYNVTYDISHNSSHLHEVIHDLAYNESCWHYCELSYYLEEVGPNSSLSWIYSREDDTTFQLEAITDPTAFKATLEQYLLNFSTTLAEEEAFLYVTQELALNRSGRTCLLTPSSWGNYPRLGRLLLTTTMGRPVIIMLIYYQ
ncbi:MAG: hypothetical protein ACFFC7_18050 [Candidatus Hermodarchaeota archaeon]